MRVIENAEQLIGLVGQELGASDWIDVTQDMIDRFAEVTGDHQWIHVDVERAAAESPFGSTIAHGFLTLSLVPVLTQQITHLAFRKAGVNYGLNRVRFPSPVKVGSRLRARSRLKQVENTDPRTYRITNEVTLEIEGSEKPACVAETVSLALV